MSRTAVSPIGFGRNGERVANTPTRLFPPSLGGLTVGDHFSIHFLKTATKATNENISQYHAVPLPCGIRFKYDNSFGLMSQRSPLPWDSKFFRKICINGCTYLHFHFPLYFPKQRGLPTDSPLSFTFYSEIICAISNREFQEDPDHIPQYTVYAQPICRFICWIR